MTFLYSINNEKFYYLDGKKKICLNKKEYQEQIDFEEFYEFGEFTGNTEKSIQKLFYKDKRR